jgi:hypothetical protein
MKSRLLLILVALAIVAAAGVVTVKWRTDAETLRAVGAVAGREEIPDPRAELVEIDAALADLDGVWFGADKAALREKLLDRQRQARAARGR